MAYTKNKLAFAPNAQQSDLFDSYRTLVTIELALKEKGLASGTSGHDIPLMLAQLSVQSPSLGQSLNTHQSKLTNALKALFCNNKSNSAVRVSANNYPHTRYTRLVGDWLGTYETPASDLEHLKNECMSLYDFLKSQQVPLGIQI
jgi:hypothetical protein